MTQQTPEVVTDVAVEPISLELAYAHLRIDTNDDSPPTSDDDPWLTMVGIPSARETAEQFCGVAFGEKTLRFRLPAFPAGGIELPVPPLVAVDTVVYLDVDGVEQTLGTGDYEIDYSKQLPSIVPTAAWPATSVSSSAVVVTYTAGYTTVPKAALGGMLLLLGHYYKNREAVTDKQAYEMPIGIEWTLRPFRVRMGMA